LGEVIASNLARSYILKIYNQYIYIIGIVVDTSFIKKHFGYIGFRALIYLGNVPICKFIYVSGIGFSILFVL
jgi:hypothetical protein